MQKLNSYFPLILSLLVACVGPSSSPEEWEGDGKSDGFGSAPADAIGALCDEGGNCGGGELFCFRGICVMECEGLCPGSGTFCVDDPSRNVDFGPFYNPAALPEWRGLCVRRATSDADCNRPELDWTEECCRINQGGEFYDGGVLMCRGDHTTSEARGTITGGLRYEVVERYVGDTDVEPMERGVCMPYRDADCGDDGRGYDWSTPGY